MKNTDKINSPMESPHTLLGEIHMNDRFETSACYITFAHTQWPLGALTDIMVQKPNPGFGLNVTKEIFGESSEGEEWKGS